MLPYVPDGEDADLDSTTRTTPTAMPKCVVVDETLRLGGRPAAEHPVERDGHLRDAREGLHASSTRTSARICAAPTRAWPRSEAIEYLQRLGVTAVELLPVHHIADEAYLVERGLTNYWGYNSIGFFAPACALRRDAARAGEQVREFKGMVKALHRAGIEVILDVVYNHTAEGNHLGPMLVVPRHRQPVVLPARARRPALLHRLHGHRQQPQPGAPERAAADHGLAALLRVEMHVDGFRFDLAAALARELHEVDRLSAFFDIIHQDPILSQVKLIAEPWDVGEGGYQVGNFPVLWTEWNGQYRDVVRDFWRGEARVGDFADRASPGSADLYERDGRRPYASINFVTAHDGFTLRDLVSTTTSTTRRTARTTATAPTTTAAGTAASRAPTDDPEINALRARQQRNFLATLLLSQGVPMLLGGDEIGRTQHGNNNAYCQDNEISWFDWDARRRTARRCSSSRAG